VNAQLSLTGVATKANILGGSSIGVHPGDTVVFKASPAPTAGLADVPSLGPVLNATLSTLLGSQYQVLVTFPASFPGGAKTITLGGPTKGVCKGVPSKSVTFPNKGTFAFTWKVQYVVPALLGCSKNGVSDANLNLLGKAGVKINASNSWVGKIIVANNPPPGGISIQLPGVSVAPSLPVVGQLPTIGVPGVSLPTIKVSVPKLKPSLPGGGKSTSPAPGGTTSSGGQADLPVPAGVVPQGNGGGVLGGTNPGSFDPGTLPNVSGQVSNLSPLVPIGSRTSGAAPDKQNSTGKNKTIDLASGRAASSQLPVILAILAIIALALVAGTYARLFLRRQAP
jgi:hypothetical protein